MITQEELLALFKYYNGNIYWRVDRGSNKTKGKLAGFKTKRGYIKVSISGKDYPVHRIIFMMIHGVWSEEIDHKNQIRDDNNIGNLRSVSHQVNGKNQSMWNTNTSGSTGVYIQKKKMIPTGRYLSKIYVNGKSYHLGVFATFNEALEARSDAENKYGFYKSHGKELKNEKYRDS